MFASIHDINFSFTEKNDNNKLRSYGAFLVDDVLRNKLSLLEDGNFLVFLNTYQMEMRFLETGNKIPVSFEDTSPETKNDILDLLSSHITVYKFSEAISESFFFMKFIRKDHVDGNSGRQYGFLQHGIKGSYLEIYFTNDSDINAIIADINTFFTQPVLESIKYYFFLRLQDRIKNTLKEDLERIDTFKQALETNIANNKSAEKRISDNLRKTNSDIQNISNEQISKYKSNVLNSRTRIQSKGTSVFPERFKYSIDYSIDREHLIINNAEDISKNLSNYFLQVTCEDSDKRLRELNDNINKEFNKIFRNKKLDALPDNTFLRAAGNIQTGDMLGDMSYYFNFNEIEVDKSLRLQWPDMKSLLMSFVFSMIFFYSIYLKDPKGNLLDMLKDNPSLFMLRSSLFFFALITFFYSLYQVNKYYFKAFFRKGKQGVKDLRTVRVKKQIDALILKQMTDYISSTSDNITNLLDSIQIKYRELSKEISERTESYFYQEEKDYRQLRLLAQKKLSELNGITTYLQTKTNAIN